MGSGQRERRIELGFKRGWGGGVGRWGVGWGGVENDEDTTSYRLEKPQKREESLEH